MDRSYDNVFTCKKVPKKNHLLYMSLRRFLIGTNIFNPVSRCRLELINISNSVRIFFKTNRLDSFIIPK